MNYYSTNNNSPVVNFKDATINGQAPDKGLYFPEFIPALPEGLIENIEGLSNEEIAFRIIQPYVGNTIPEDVLKTIVTETVNFSIPLVPVTDSISSLELYHGPTLAFKDIGARFMSRCLSYFVRNENKKVTVLVATSGDTGGAVANGFYDVPNVDVIILYPSGKVSSVQEKQLTTLGKNIHALEINGTFDDCQQMVKNAFMDEELTGKIFLTSANSINVARWLPQQFYYFFAYKQWADKTDPPVISVPSGNFGNICAGILAQASGLPVKHFIAACNANDVVPRFLDTNQYQPKKAVATISNAMDVGEPSNFVRILKIFSENVADLKTKLSGWSVSDEQTKATIKLVFEEEGYLLDPHGAVGYFALNEYLRDHPEEKGLVIETAHPVKFYDVVEPVIGTKVVIPAVVEEQLKLEKKSVWMENDYESLKGYLLKK
ncbi:threonine synthase [Ferruginibacter sp. HRS2-29]|uniref:threonine synthase n=1 Tax=Ferruginibacter sp. HRS2-29 TaxID=2487334 RepID=UPI0020CDBEBC|nr:threonine synthase [Ferruginibacter sp. HRS2-29]MCP9751757.1 threonine synthase [Ferruginibacter sp. HRS2-29]